MTTPTRKKRYVDVLSQRLSVVHCAIEALFQRHNAAAILRSCDAMGVHNVHLAGTNPKRATPGAARGTQQWLNMTQYPSIESAIENIHKQDLDLWVADLSPNGLPPEEVPLDRPICIWLGAELEGVHPEAKAAANGVITIPMRGFTESLNVSVAAALTLRTIAERARKHWGSDGLLPTDTQARILSDWLQRDDDMAKRMRRRTE